MANGNPECSECYNKKKLGTQCKCTLTLINIVHLHLDTAYCALETVHLHLDTAYHALQCLILMANGNPGNSECYNNKSVRDTVHVCLGTCKHSAFCTWILLTMHSSALSFVHPVIIRADCVFKL